MSGCSLVNRKEWKGNRKKRWHFHYNVVKYYKCLEYCRFLMSIGYDFCAIVPENESSGVLFRGRRRDN